MMKYWVIIVAIVLVLSGCSNLKTNPFGGQVSIDWVDFVKLGSNSYTGLSEIVISNPDLITNDVVGEVKFKVADVVTNAHYRTKAGDAAFLEKGTKLYRVAGFEIDQLIAVQDENMIGGYRLYVTQDFADTIAVYYKDIEKDKVKRIEIYQYRETKKPINTLFGDEKAQFINFLENGEESSNYNPNTENGYPIYYNMVFYADGLLAYSHTIVDDYTNVFFYPWNTRMVDAEIRKWLQ